MAYKTFGEFLRELREETTSGDIATVDTKLGYAPKRLMRGKKCKKHHKFECPECSEDSDSKWS